MSTLSYLLTDNIADPRKEGLPCFAMTYGNANNQFSLRVFNSQFQVMLPPYGNVDYTTTSSYRYGMAMDPFYMYSWSDSTDPESVLGTESAGGGSNWYQSMHQNDQYPSAMYADISSLGYRTGVNFLGSSTTGNSKPGSGRYLINQVLPEGVRPRRFFSIESNTMWESSSMTQLLGNVDRYDFSALRPTGFTARASCIGAAGYNEKTKQLVIVFGDSGGASTATVLVFTGNVDLNSCSSLQQFFTGATVKAFDISITYDATNLNDKTVVVGDNGKVVIGYRVGGNLYGAIFDVNAATPTATALNAVSGTTSYGLNSGPEYYTKMQLSWDGKWAFIYQPYYYYGCGVCGYIVSTEDPTRYFTYLDTSSSGGGAVMPNNTSRFVVFNGSNTDSAGVYANVIDLTNTSRTGSAATTIATSGGNVAAIANGGAVNAGFQNLHMHGGFYSTCYPRIFTVNWWPINGKWTYEGAIRNA